MTSTPHLALVAFVSALVQPLHREILEPLLSRWRVANAQRGVTGLLLIDDEACFQVIEGFPDTIEDLYAAIARDPRHRHVTRLVHRQTDQRCFGDWSLGLSRAARADLAAIPGLEALGAGLGYGGLAWAQAERIIEAFREGYWRRTIG